MLWCADFFSLDLCNEEPFTCSVMVVMVLGSNFLLIGLLIFLFMKAFCKRNNLQKKMSMLIHRKSSSLSISGRSSNGETKTKSSGAQKKKNSTKKRRTSSRELMMLEMVNVGAEHGAVRAESIVSSTTSEEKTEVVNVSAVNPMLLRNTHVAKRGGLVGRRKNRLRKKGRQHNGNRASQDKSVDQPSIDKKSIDESAAHEPKVEILTDDVSGRRYSHVISTGHTEWLNTEDEDEAEVKFVEKTSVETEEKDIEILIDDASGRKYFYNESIGASEWVDTDDDEE